MPLIKVGGTYNGFIRALEKVHNSKRLLIYSDITQRIYGRIIVNNEYTIIGNEMRSTQKKKPIRPTLVYCQKCDKTYCQACKKIASLHLSNGRCALCSVRSRQLNTICTSCTEQKRQLDVFGAAIADI